MDDLSFRNMLEMSNLPQHVKAATEGSVQFIGTFLLNL